MKDFVLALVSLGILSCGNSDLNSTVEPENFESFQRYWYDGQAEISSYNLKQARYGEIREGNAVLIFVTEPYSTTFHTKADEESDDNITVMKLNATKNFVTGIYPYSIMTSVFYPIDESKHSIKLSSSTQEWCGQTYMELIRDKDFDITINSYFQGESKNHIRHNVALLEDEIWTMIRVRPTELPEGNQEIIPSFSYLRLSHKELKPYACVCSKEIADDKTIYKMVYDELERSLEIQYETEFPHKILSWEETYPCGSCEAKEKLTSSGHLIETIKVDYWNKNSVADSTSRFKLGLH